MQKRSVTIAGHRTSISLEEEFWELLTAAAADEGLPLAQLVGRIDEERTTNLSSAIRVWLVRRLLARQAGGGSAPEA